MRQRRLLGRAGMVSTMLAGLCLLAFVGASLPGVGGYGTGVASAAERAVDGGGSRGLAMWATYARLAPVNLSAAGAPLGPEAAFFAGLQGSAATSAQGTTGATPVSLQAGGLAVMGLVGRPVDVPSRVLAAYRAAAAAIDRVDPGCHLTWPLLAGIGKIESGHARGGAVDANGRTLTPILGPVLAGGSGFAAIRDTDHGRYDGDTTWDRAVGPMQFIPSSWALYGRDGNGDGVADPSNVDDAALASAAYLCAGSKDLRDTASLRRAVYGYNHSWSYVATVLAWMTVYAEGGAAAPGTVQQASSAGSGSQVAASPSTHGGSTQAGPPPPSTPAPSSRPTSSPRPTQSGTLPAPTQTATGAPATTSPAATTSSPVVTTPSPTGTSTSPDPTGSPSPTATGCPTASATPTVTATDGTTSSTVAATTPPPPTDVPTDTASGAATPPADPCATTDPADPAPAGSATVSPRAVEGP